jgi:hypothetical protein
MSGEDKVQASLPHLIVHSSSSTCSECRRDSLIENTHVTPSGYLQTEGCGVIYRYVVSGLAGVEAARACQRIADSLGLPFKNTSWGTV